MNKSTVDRFSNRVYYYQKYRPDYPQKLLDFMRDQLHIDEHCTIADIGSGTGKLTKLLLEQSKIVYGIEPNNEMRVKAEKELSLYSNFISVDGTATNTGLSEQSVDAVAVAQAFHWFHIPKSIAEFRRILKADGFLLLLWNRRLTTTPFLKSFDKALRRYGTDYNEIDHKKLSDIHFSQCFREGKYQHITFDNNQYFNYEELIGFLNSLSYVPDKNTESYKYMLENIYKAFEVNKVEERVEMKYETDLFWGIIR